MTGLVLSSFNSSTTTVSSSSPNRQQFYPSDGWTLPASRVKLEGTRALDGNEFYDVLRGEIDGQTPALLKVHRTAITPEMVRKRLRGLTVRWVDFSRRDNGRHMINVLGLWSSPEIGFQATAIVSVRPADTEFMKYMELADFTQSDRKLMVVSLAESIKALHTSDPEPIVHCDIRPSNMVIEIDEDTRKPRIVLSEFGLTEEILEQTGVTVRCSIGNQRYVAPELCEAYTAPTLKSDVFAFAMSALEIMTGDVPFSEKQNGNFVVTQIHAGKRPSRPPVSLIDDDLWNLITECWAQNPDGRPSIQEILVRLG